MTNEELQERIDQIDLVVDKHEESVMLLLKLRKHFKDQIKYKFVITVDGLGHEFRKKVPI